MADTARSEQLRRLYVQRDTICLAGRVADEAVVRGDRGARIEAERLFAELKRIDLAINRLENTSGTIQ